MRVMRTGQRSFARIFFSIRALSPDSPFSTDGLSRIGAKTSATELTLVTILAVTPINQSMVSWLTAPNLVKSTMTTV